MVETFHCPGCALEKGREEPAEPRLLFEFVDSNQQLVRHLLAIMSKKLYLET